MTDTAIDLTSRETFPFWTREIIRFADLDRYGHVNNVAFAVQGNRVKSSNVAVMPAPFSSFPRKRESMAPPAPSLRDGPDLAQPWIPAFAGMTGEI